MNRRSLRWLLATVLVAHAPAQQVLTTFAGADWIFPGNGKPAVDAPLNKTTAITFDPHGRPVFADSDNCIVAAMEPDGTLSVIAGNGFCSPRSGDGGSALNAAMQPLTLAYDPQGNLYIGESNVIRKVSPQGIITAFAGTGNDGFSGDGGPATMAQFYDIVALAADASGNVYVSDSGNGRVRRVDAGGIVTTYAGTPGNTPVGNGSPATSAVFVYLEGIALDSKGALYISDTVAIYKVSGGVINAVGPRGGNICLDSAGTVYASYYATVGKLPPGAPDFVAVAGTGKPGFGGDGSLAINAQLGADGAVAVDTEGNLWIADTDNGRIREVTPDGIIRTVAGNGNYRYAGEGLPALQSPLHDLFGLAVDPAGTVYFSEGFNDTGSSRLRKVANGVVTTVAGMGTEGYSGDNGPAVQSQLNWPAGMAIDKIGAVYVADNNNLAIRRVDPSGSISTYAPVDGGPVALAFDPAGRLYSSNYDKSEVILVDPQGNHLTVAGNGTGGFSGDGGPATSAMLSEAYALAFDAAGNMYIADIWNGRVRKVTPQGTISTFAGGGTGASGLATEVGIYEPSGLAFDAAGNLYIAEAGDGYIDRVTPAGVLSRFAGGGPLDQLGDGKIATSATLAAPMNMAFDSAGNLYIADSGNNRIRMVPARLPTIMTSSSSLSLSASSGGAPVTQPLTVLGSLSGLDFTVAVQTAGGGAGLTPWLTVDTGSGSTPRILNLTADPGNTAPGTYQATVTITPAAATPASIRIPVTLTVGPAQPPQLSVDTANLTFTFPAGAAAQTSQVRIVNGGGGSLAFTASATTAAGSAWLSVTPASGSVTPGAPLALTVQANPTAVTPGTYTGAIAISTGAAGSVVIPVTMTLSSLPQALLLTQSGMSFVGVANGGVVPPQSFGIVNTGSGMLNWTATTSTLTGGNWLKLAPSPATGSTTAGSVAPRLSVSVDVTGLAAGNYYGLVSVSAPGAANSPRLLVAALNVLPAGSNPGAVVQPSEIVFTAPTDSAPGSQTISVYNIGATPQDFQTSTSTQVGDNALLYASPRQGTLDPAQPTVITLQPTDVYNGVLTLDAGGSVQTVIVTTATQTVPLAAGGNFRRRDSCTPTKLMPALTSLGPAFTVSAGWPIALTAQVFDDCGNPHLSGSVTLTFSNGDSPVAMSSLNDGTWQGTWPTRGDTNSGVIVTVTAVNPNLCDAGQCLTGTRQVTGGLGSLQDPPDFQPAGIVGAASPVSFQPLAPGSIFSIYGDRLAETAQAASAIPLPSQLGNATVVIGDKVAPLYFGSQQQVNAVVPFELNTGTTYDLVVQRGPTYSHVAPISIAAAQPGVFSPNGAPLAYDYTGTAPFFISPQTPAHAGDAVVLYCGGLGAPAQPVADGASSPTVALQNAVTAAIGGVNAPVAYAGLVGGFVGLYQVNLTVPSGVAPGDAVSLTLTVAGQTSPPASLAVR